MKIRIRSIDKTVKEEYALSLLALFPVVYTPVIYLASYSIGGSVGSFIKYGLYLYAGLLALNCGKRIIRSIRINSLFFVLWFLTQYALQLVLHSGHNGYYIGLLTQTVTCFLWFLAASNINDYEILFKSIKAVAYIVLIATILFLLYNGIGSYRLDNGVSYNQAISYCFLIAPIVFVIEIVKKPRLISIVLLVVSIAVSFLLGTRGMLICIVICAAICILTLSNYNDSLSKQKKLFIVFAIVAVGIVVSVFFDRIMEILLILEGHIGGNGRVIYKILNGNFYYSEGRNDIWEAALKVIKENVFFGVGMATDRLYLRDAMNATATVYSHNIMLEILLQYGVIIGIPLLIFCLHHVIRVFRISRTNINLYSAYICVLCIGIVPLLMSSSYLQWSTFYVFAGMIFSVRNRFRSKVAIQE